MRAVARKPSVVTAPKTASTITKHNLEVNVKIPVSSRDSKYDFGLDEMAIGQSRFIEVLKSDEMSKVKAAISNAIHKQREGKRNDAGELTVNFLPREEEKNGRQGFRIFCVDAKDYPIRQFNRKDEQQAA